MLGAAVGSLLAASVLFARADGPTSTVSIDNFTFGPQKMTVKAGTTVTWTNKDDNPHGIASSNNAFKKSAALDTDDSYFVHLHHAGDLSVLLLRASAHGGLDRRGSGNGQQRYAMMPQSATATATARPGSAAAPGIAL